MAGGGGEYTVCETTKRWMAGEGSGVFTAQPVACGVQFVNRGDAMLLEL